MKELDGFLERDRDRGTVRSTPPPRRFLMAAPAEPATDALYQALSSPEPDPQVWSMPPLRKFGI